MSLKYHPNPGAILICNFAPGFQPPEMTKRRPVVVISPRLRKRNDLCSVVPLSTTPPQTIEAYHYELTFDRAMPKPWNALKMWVKADMIATVSFDRLDLIRAGHDHEGKRKYLTKSISNEDLTNIRQCVLHALGLSALTPYL